MTREITALLKKTPTPALWWEVVEQLDACDEAELQKIFSDVERVVSQWTTQSMRGQLGKSFDDAATGVNHDPFGIWHEVRVAPRHWLKEMAHGASSPKYRLVRAVDFTYSQLAHDEHEYLVLRHPDLMNVERVALGAHAFPDEPMIATLCAHPNMAKLASLRLGRWSKESTELLFAHGKDARALKRLSLAKIYSERKRIGLETLHQVPLFSTLTQLVLCDGIGREEKLCKAIIKDRALPALDTLRFSENLLGPSDSVFINLGSAHLQKLLADRITHLDIGPFWLAAHQYNSCWGTLWSCGDFGSFETLDLRELLPTDKLHITPEDEAILLRDLPGSPILDATDTLLLGAWKSDALASALGAKHPELTLT